ncbi:MAG: T9SS type A sorting domain-containing protein [Bacteroidia bacterium]
MIRKLLPLSFVLLTFFGFGQAFSGMYHFTGVVSGTAGTGYTDPTPTPTANGVTFGSFSAVGYTNFPTANEVFNFNNQPLGATNGDNTTFTGAVDPSKYYEVTLTPMASSTITLNEITFNMSRSSTGPRHWVVRGSADSYGANLPASIAPSNSNISVQGGDVFFWNDDAYTVTGGKQEVGSKITLGSGYQNQTSAMTFRWYSYDAEGNAGTFRLDTVTISGSNGVSSGISKITYDLNSKLLIYPNPGNTGYFNIEAKSNEISSIDVVNQLGQIVKTFSPSYATEKITVTITDLPDGVYFINAKTTKGIIQEKVVISNR